MRLVRTRELRAYDRGDETAVLGADGALRELAGPSAGLVRALLDHLVEPRSLDQIAAHLTELAGEDVRVEGAVADALTLLRAAGAIEIAEHSPSAAAPTKRARRRLVLALTGGVAASTAPTFVSILQQRGFEVRVAATRRALKFVTPLALEALTHARVRSSLWPDDPEHPVPHLELARWAEIVLVWPASATSLARIASGSCATLVSALVVSTRAPVVLVPSMNERMARSPLVTRNVERLRADGFFVVHPGVGFEVADRPGARKPMLGTSPPHVIVAELVEAIVARHAPLPVDPIATWDATYAQTPVERLPWFAPGLDDDVARALEARGARGRFLDLGTGPGSAAIDAARRGFAVVATDVSPRALAIASERAGALPIAFVEDDAGRSRLRGTFDVVHDRGCLHALPRAHHAAYAASVASLTRPGSLFLLKVMGDDEPADLGVHLFSTGEVRALFDATFDVEDERASTIAGPSLERRARLFVLRRKGGG